MAPGDRPSNFEIESPSSEPARLKCLAEGGVWNAETQTCNFGLPPVNQGTVQQPLARTPRELAAENERIKAARLGEDAAKLKRDKAAEEAALDVPVGQNVDLTASGGVDFSSEITSTSPTRSSPPGTVVTDAETGIITGFINSLGEFVKASRQDVQAKIQKDLNKTTIPTGSITSAQFQEQERLTDLTQRIGQIGGLTAAEEAEINLSQALTAGFAQASAGLAGGAAIGGAAGLVGSAGVLSLPGAALVGGAGAVGGFVRGVLGNIKEQQRGELKAADLELSQGLRSMRQLAMLASRDPANADVYISQYNQVLTRVHQAKRQTKVEVTGDLNSFMEDGREQLADFDLFLRPGGLADIYGQKLQGSLVSGVPLSINGEELVFDENN